MKLHDVLAAGLVTLALTMPVRAADFADPTWPCLQRKVENLSIGLMWPHPLAEIKLTPETARAADELAESLVLRRVSMEDAQSLVADFSAVHGSGEPLMGHVFEKVFKNLASRRGQIIHGIEEFSLSQIAMTQRIDTARTEMDQQMAADAPDFDKVDKLEEQTDWDERIYTDRQKSLTYVCETPVLLEKRLFAIAQMLIQTLAE
ncbi:hypothetical protein [Puniceibacterium sp. IMCC21224]|uniref:hypothetical protein n=1 Tax=Puniceibacterium sp. IMCC21224 TaxID=1618204 RepID=UPI00064DB70E|nr:hypothetical protein [Puniceibacterium sp. IMCC21224]KMK65472.1 hypothetical protein IMCC21224_11303 [Puniceibacterium sp. IMCC21224]